jgi:CHASE3 domain sensor protein
MATTGKKKTRKFLIVVLVFVAVLGVSITLLIKYANQIIKSELERRLSRSFSIERIDLAWGHVEAVGV